MIIIDRVSKNLGGTDIVKDLSFTLEENKTTVFMGTSGTGKTTLFNMLSGLTSPDSGRITGFEHMKKSFVFQENRLLENRNAMKNILCVTKDSQRAEYFINECGLSCNENKKAAELSGGMRRRLAVARALAYDGDAFFMDEPLREMDEATMFSVAKTIKKALDGKTAVIITHDRAAAEYLASRIIVFSGSPMQIAEDRYL